MAEDKDNRNKFSVFENDNSRSIVQRFLSFIGLKKLPKITLEERIQRFQRTAQDRLSELQETRKFLEKSVSKDLIKYVDKIMTPMMRKVTRMNQISTEAANSPDDQNILLGQYKQWISRTEQIVKAFSERRHDRKNLINTVVKQILRILSDRITTDLKTIRDYIKHRLNDLDLQSEDKRELAKRIDAVLQPCLLSLKSIRKEIREYRKGSYVTLEEAIERQLKVDRNRKKNSEKALHLVDGIIKQMNNFDGESPDVLNHVLLNLQELSSLEISVPKLLHAAQSSGMSSETITELRDELMDLEEDMADLDQLLDVTPEIADRVKKISSDLEEAHSLLFSKG